MDCMERANWVWTPDWTAEDDAAARIVLFRRNVTLSRNPSRAALRVSADTRYKLYINGKFVQAGPSKGDRQVWFADDLDITGYLRRGENALAVEVLRYPLYGHSGAHSLFRTETPGLYLCGRAFFDGAESPVEFSSNGAWRCHVNRATAFYAEEERFAPLTIHEHAAGDPDAFRWKAPDFDDSAWEYAKPYGDLSGAVSPAGLSPRPAPLPYHVPRTFAGVFDIPRSEHPAETWTRFVKNALPVALPAHTETVVVFDAGEEMNGYLSLAVCGGAGANIELLEAECYEIPTENGFTKQNRLDKARGVLRGYRDTYGVLGTGTPDAPEVYEPYFYRTFRLVRLTVRTGDAPLTLQSFAYAETGYPLDAATQVSTSDASLSAIWDISLRTLKRCMHETYIDCPFYERLQYVMDTRSQILYTYAVSADERLARKAIDDFARAQRADGLLNCSYPNMNPNVIPGFSLYYVLMVHDHMMYFGDKTLVRRTLPTIDRVLNFFDARLTPEGLVGQIGGVNGQAPFWSFIDWAEPWMETEGMPTAGLTGPVTMESLLYLLGLQKAAELADYVEWHCVAEEYRRRADTIRLAVRGRCRNESGMITDGVLSAPNGGSVSQHGQVFGILTGVLTPEEGRRNLLETVRNPARYAQCTVAMCFYLFRALEKTGLYEYTNQYWDIWRKMLDNGCTTCVEAEHYARSECHAWGALALYELPTVILGVRPAAPGYAKIQVRPVPGYLDSASGTVRTPKGDVCVSWRKGADGLEVSYSCPDNPALEKIMS